MKNIILKILDKKPPTFSSSLLLNLLGLQLLRIFTYNFLRIMRIPKKVSKENEPYLKELIKNGVCAIPNFLPQDSYNKLLDEYLMLEVKFKREDKGLPVPYVDGIDFYDKNVSDSFRSFFLNSGIINQLSLGFLNRKLNLPLNVRLANIYLEDMREADLPQNGFTNNLHADTPMRTLKMFYYVTDTDENNAALKYCLGSNRMSLSRLWIEYKMSVRFALNKWRPHPDGQYPAGKPWVEITENEKKKLNLEPQSLPAKGNTLVLVDIGGFHQRGEFKTLTPRKTVEINYRPIDTLRNYVYPLERILFRKEHKKM